MAGKDYSAIKFEVAEALGEWMNCLYLKGIEGKGSEFQFIHHKDADGMSAIKKILRDEGHTLKSLPGLKRSEHPSPLSKIIALIRYIRLTKKVNQQWLSSRKDMTGVPKGFVLTKIPSGEIENLKKKATHFSLNAFLINALDSATLDNLLTTDSERKWILPLNMRDADRALEINGNYSGSIVLNLKKRHSSPEVHQMIKSYLMQKIHWGSFLYSNMARFIGFKGTLKVARSIKEVGTGVFSNLGSWPENYVELADQKVSWRAVVAPSTQILPVAATAWQWRETLCFTLQLHPSLNVSEEMAEKVMASWLDYLGVKDHEQEYIPWSRFPDAPKTP